MMDHRRLARDLRTGDRHSLSRAITLIESVKPEHRQLADLLISTLAENRRTSSLRIGLSGSPGTGKSTLINRLGMQLIDSGKRIAVLAVDPSSERSGGSILGDKTRMDELSNEAQAFIRPSPTNRVLGGVAARTRDTIFLCEHAGFDIIFVETTGVGQSETLVANLTDIFLLLIAPAAGDELQGVKRGIMEMADLLAITKADGDLRATAEQTCAEYASALHLFARREKDPPDYPKAVKISAFDPELLQGLWHHISEIALWRRRSGVWIGERKRQDRLWILSQLRESRLNALENDQIFLNAQRALNTIVAEGGTSYEREVRELLRKIEGGGTMSPA